MRSTQGSRPASSKKKPSTSASTPAGRLTQNTQRQSKTWISQPPSVGPKAGASIRGTPRTDIRRPRCSGAAIRMMIVIPTGITMPPARPWMTLNPISDWRFQASPQRPEAMVKATSVTR